MTKSLGKIIVKGFIFLLLFFLAIIALEPLFSESKHSVWDDFYAQKKNSIDVLILGNSHANAGFDEDIIEAKLHSKVISLATKGQNIYQSYYCALEAYEYQTPKVLIIENYLFYERLTLKEFINLDPSNNDYLKRYLSFDGKKLGKVKYSESKEFFNGNFIENLFVTFNRHDGWSDVEKIKERLYESDSITRKKSTTIMSPEKADAYSRKNKYNLMAFNILQDEEKALEGIIELARKKGTEHIILLTVPFYEGYRNKINYTSLSSPLESFVKDNPDVEYLDLNKQFSNWDNTYFTNELVGYNQHLNYKGAIKVSNYVSDYIKPTFNSNHNNSIEYYLYNDIQKDTLTEGIRILGNLERLNGKKRVSLEVDQPYTQIIFEGWMAIENNSSDTNEMFIGLKKDKDFVFISDSRQLAIKERKDVSKYFDKTNIYDQSGFRISINSSLLEKGIYKAFMIIRNKNGEVLLKPAKKTIEIL